MPFKSFQPVLILVVLLLSSPLLAETLTNADIEIHANHLESTGAGRYVATGYVDIRFGEFTLLADRAEVNMETGFCVAEGNVVLLRGEETVSGERIEIQLDSGHGTIYNASGSGEPDVYFRAEQIEKVGDQTFLLHRGTFTSCNQPKPYWDFRVKEARVTIGGYAHMKGVSLRVLEVPIFYLPRLIWPVKKDRATGFLIPTVGYNQLRGAQLRNSFFWAINPSSDTTFSLDSFSKQDVGVGNEFRYLSSRFQGEWDGYLFFEDATERERYNFNYIHNHFLPGGIRTVLSLNLVDGIDFYQDFERAFLLHSRREEESELYFTKNMGIYSFNLRGDRRETFFSPGHSVLLSRKPELEIRSREQSLFNSPLFFSFQSSLGNLQNNRGGSSSTYQRYHLAPRFTLPLSPSPWINLNADLSTNYTYYSKHPATTFPSTVVDESADQGFLNAQINILGPRFHRVYQGRDNALFTKFNHVIEPRITYQFAEAAEPDVTIFRFDEIDTLFTDQNLLSYALTTRLQGKRADSENTVELLSFELSQRLSLNGNALSQRGSKASDFSPLSGTLRVRASDFLSIDSGFSFDVLSDTIERVSFATNFQSPRRLALRLNWFRRFALDPLATDSHQVNTGLRLNLFGEKLNFNTDFDFDIEQDILRHQRYRVQYDTQCCGFVFEYLRNRVGVFSDPQILFSINLRNVGTLLEVQGL